MKDENILEGLYGPVSTPNSLEENTSGRFTPETQQMVDDLINGSGSNLDIGSGTPSKFVGTNDQVSNVAGLLKAPDPGETIIADAPLTESEIDTEFFREGGTKKQDRQSDRQTRKAEGLKGSNKRQQRKADRRARKRSWDDSQV